MSGLVLMTTMQLPRDVKIPFQFRGVALQSGHAPAPKLVQEMHAGNASDFGSLAGSELSEVEKFYRHRHPGLALKLGTRQMQRTRERIRVRNGQRFHRHRVNAPSELQARSERLPSRDDTRNLNTNCPKSSKTAKFCLRPPLAFPYKERMKFTPFLVAVAVFAIGASMAVADIQAPPASEYGPTRKLGRGLGNILFGYTELPIAMEEVNYADGNAAAFSYGIVRGIGRSAARLGYGVYEVLLFPFPTSGGKYTPPYKCEIPWINRGYGEFPPELGFESRYSYVRFYSRDPN